MKKARKKALKYRVSLSSIWPGKVGKCTIHKSRKAVIRHRESELRNYLLEV